MIIEQDIQLRDRSTLQLLKTVAKQQRDERKQRITQGGQLFAEKWNTERLGDHFTQTYIPRMLSQAVEQLIDSKPKKDEPASFKSMIMESLDRIIPILIRRIWT